MKLSTLTCLLCASVLGSHARLESPQLTLGLQPDLATTKFPGLLARQVCAAPKSYCSTGCCDPGLWCCASRSCIDLGTHHCCSGGSQCQIGRECCAGGCCKPGAQCCSNGRCCSAGTRCVVNTLTGERGCLSDSSVRSSSAAPPPTTTTPPATTTTHPCLDTSLTLCADHRFCCRADTYCFYDARGQPSCWAGTAYTFSYYYLWSHRWYRTATSFQLAATSVVTITVPTATEPPAATESTVRAPVETGAAGLAGLAGSVEMVTAGSVAAVKTVTATVTVTPSTSAAGRGRGRVAVLVLAVLAACLVGICGMAVHPYVVTAYAG